MLTRQTAKGRSFEGRRARRSRTPAPRRPRYRSSSPAAQPPRPSAPRLLRGPFPLHVRDTSAPLSAREAATGAPGGTDSCRGRSEPAGGLRGRSRPAGSRVPRRRVCVVPSALPALQPRPLSRASPPGPPEDAGDVFG